MSARRQLVTLAALIAALIAALPVAIAAQTPSPVAAPAPGPTPAPGPIGPPVRRIETASAVTVEPLGAITGVRPLSDGRVLVNDGTRRRLLLMDSALKTVAVVLDSLTEVENAYGTRSGALIAYRGDSTLFVDPATYAMLIIDQAGHIARVRSVPRAQDVTWLASPNGIYGVPGIDAAGRLVYRVPAQPARPVARQASNIPYFPSPPDSAFVVGIHLDTRKLDTLTAVRTQRVVMSVTMTPEGYYNINQVVSPLPLLDDWAVLPDGTVAFVRGRDYRIEWLAPDGTLTSSEKLPFPWVHLTDEDKTHFVDSLKTQQTRNAQNNFTTQMIVWSNLLNKPYPATFTPAAGYVPNPGFPRDWILPKGVAFPANYAYGCPPGVTPSGPNGGPTGAVPVGVPNGAPAAAAPAAAPGAAAAPTCIANQYADYYGGGYTPPAPTYRPPTLVRPSELPDYRPPIAAGATRADAEGNLWIRTVPMKPAPGGPIYDIVNRAGALVDRIQLPSGYTLVGFAPGKVVYLTMRDAGGLHLARVRLK
jgi:hypothetical protein